MSSMEQQIQFPNHRGEKLSATIHFPDGPSRRGVILGHCFTCSRHTTILRSICHALAASGFLVLRFDFSGNGQSEGEFADSTYSKQMEEMKTAAAFLAERGVAWLGLAGHSMGATVALLAAAEIPSVRALCALAARSRVMDAAELLTPAQLQDLQGAGRVRFVSRGRPLELTREMFSDAARYDVGRAVSSLLHPLLLVQGDRDEITPVDEAYCIQRYRPERTRLAVIPGADHMFSRGEHRRMVTEVVGSWFREQALLGREIRNPKHEIRNKFK
jgi:pimeloyl-ACP methyl ester carboxylesterase